MMPMMHQSMIPPSVSSLRSRVTLSVIVPALNEEAHIAALIERLRDAAIVHQIIVVDGGSHDETVAVARLAGARVEHSPRGRGAQMAAGAALATGDVLWFLHADTIPAQESAAAVAEAMADPRLAGGNCTIRFDGDRRCARFLSWLYPHLRKLGLLYGDSGIFVRRADYFACGGFQPFPIFEDLDLVRRIRRRGSLASLSTSVVTSSRRFEGRSFPATFACWSGLQVLYWCGVSPARLGRLYYREKKPRPLAATPPAPFQAKGFESE